MQNVLISIGVIAGAVVAALAAHAVLVFVLRRSHAAPRGVTLALARRCSAPARVLLVTLGLAIAVNSAPMPDELIGRLRHGIGLTAIAAVAWGLVRLAAVVEDVLMAGFDLGSADNLRGRTMQTQIVVFRRIVGVVVAIVAAAVMLTTFPQVRIMGASILASAGIIGLVLGVAAQSTLSNMLAGIQIAVTHPIRLDDVVVLEGEWGRVEEITFTYVVVRVWDERRLIVPISYFATHPFQNWTRARADILGIVTLRVDYTVAVEEVRHELDRLVHSSPLWDGRLSLLQVTEADDRGVELRGLMSAGDSSKAWDLRCAVREGLVTFLQERYPGALPRVRAEILPRGGVSEGAASA